MHACLHSVLHVSPATTATTSSAQQSDGSDRCCLLPHVAGTQAPIATARGGGKGRWVVVEGEGKRETVREARGCSETDTHREVVPAVAPASPYPNTDTDTDTHTHMHASFLIYHTRVSPNSNKRVILERGDAADEILVCVVRLHNGAIPHIPQLPRKSTQSGARGEC